MANATPAILCHDGGSRKKRMPTMAMIAGAAGQDRWNRRERTAFLKKKKERDRPSAYADSGKQRIIEPGCAEFLIPPPANQKMPR